MQKERTTSVNRLRIGIAALVTGGVLAGGLLLGGSLVSAQTPGDTPTVESDQTAPSGTTTPSTTPQADQTPSTDKGTPDNGTTTPQDRQHGDHMCDKDGDGQMDGPMDGSSGAMPGGTSFHGNGMGYGTRGAMRQ